MDFSKRSGSTTTNPPIAQITITQHGSDWLWAVFAVMLVSALGMLAWSQIIPRGRRAFHYTAFMLLTTATIAYFSMASNLGGTPIYTEFGTPETRAIWYVRYIDWVITTPLLLLELLLATGLPLSDIIAVLFIDEVMIVTGLVGALVSSRYKWGYYAFGCAALVYIWWVLIGPALVSSATLGPEFRKGYIGSAVFLSVVWMLYPIAWGLADGSSVISADSEMIFYGVLDIVAKPVFTYYHCFVISRLDYTRLQLQSSKFSTGATLIARSDAELNGMQGNNSLNASKNARADATGIRGGAPRASESTVVGTGATI